MTPEEMQAECDRLRERIAKLERQHEGQQKHWGRCGFITGCIACVVLILNLILHVTIGPDPIGHVFQFAGLVLLVLSIAFSTAVARGDMPIGDWWSWLWSS